MERRFQRGEPRNMTSGRNHLVNLATTGEGKPGIPLKGKSEQRRIEKVRDEINALAISGAEAARGLSNRRRSTSLR